MKEVLRKCASCNEEKGLCEFSKGNKYKGRQYPNSYCKTCCREKKLQYTSDPEIKNKYENSNRRGYLLRTYGITLEQYQEMFESQKGRCAICDKHQDVLKKRMAVDHNHVTGEIRGLLCDYCNHRIVGRHRDGDLLRRVADYIEQGTGWFVPKKKRPIKRKPK